MPGLSAIADIPTGRLVIELPTGEIIRCRASDVTECKWFNLNIGPRCSVSWVFALSGGAVYCGAITGDGQECINAVCAFSAVSVLVCAARGPRPMNTSSPSPAFRAILDNPDAFTAVPDQ